MIHTSSTFLFIDDIYAAYLCRMGVNTTLLLRILHAATQVIQHARTQPGIYSTQPEDPFHVTLVGTYSYTYSTLKNQSHIYSSFSFCFKESIVYSYLPERRELELLIEDVANQVADVGECHDERHRQVEFCREGWRPHGNLHTTRPTHVSPHETKDFVKECVA